MLTKYTDDGAVISRNYLDLEQLRSSDLANAQFHYQPVGNGFYAVSPFSPHDCLMVEPGSKFVMGCGFVILKGDAAGNQLFYEKQFGDDESWARSCGIVHSPSRQKIAIAWLQRSRESSHPGAELYLGLNDDPEKSKESISEFGHEA